MPPKSDSRPMDSVLAIYGLNVL